MVENSSQLYMPVAPAYAANSGMGGGFGYNGDWWLILILLFAFGGFGGWGNGGFGGFGGADGNLLYPWMNNAQITTNGFQNQALNTAISGLQNSVTSGFGDVQLGIAGINQNLCQTGNGIVQAVNSGFSQAEIADNARQMASMQQAFANQTATAQGFNAVQGQLAQNNSDVKGGLGDIRYTIATEECATRNASATNTRSIIDSQAMGTKAILDKLCQLELDGVKAQVEAKNDRISELQTQLNMATLRESQTAQNAFISQGFANEVDQLYNRLKNCPVGTTPVYGNTPIFSCPQTASCGCGQF